MKIVWQQLTTLIVFFFFSTIFVQAQFTPIELSNPSFEDIPRHSQTPHGWRNCGFKGESPPDIQPELTFQVSKLAVEGDTYLGMVVRDNDTWESVGQLLSRPFEKGNCYEFSIKLARSMAYFSVSRELNQPANYITPTKLRIWAGYGYNKQFLLGESYLVRHEEWKKYEFKFEPDAAYTHIILEVFYQTPTLFPYNGNLLLDDASFISIIPCDTKVPEGPQDFVKEDPIAVTDPIDDPVITPIFPSGNTTTKGTDKPKETTISGVKRSEMTAGKKILLKNLQFEMDEARITASSLPALRELYEFMAANEDIRIEVGGHTNGLAGEEYALSLSTARAKSIFEYLTIKGIDPSRVKFKGYGKKQPIDTNETPEGRRNNQRVEVKIL